MSAGNTHGSRTSPRDTQPQVTEPAVRVHRMADVVQNLLTNLSAGHKNDASLYRELEALAGFIQAARRDIAALRPKDIKRQYIASATDELDAIVGATEAATNDILDAAEQIEPMLGALPRDTADRLIEITTQIYEACNFQDITGQRVTKVVDALKHIEQRIGALVAAFEPEWDHEREGAPAAPPGTGRRLDDADLLNGPQLPHVASNQDEVDALLASSD